jgi:hypothetical protein
MGGRGNQNSVAARSPRFGTEKGPTLTSAEIDEVRRSNGECEVSFQGNGVYDFEWNSS